MESGKAPDQYRHRSVLTQQNKPFKSKHASKGEQKRKSGGRVEKANVKVTSISGSASAAVLSKRERLSLSRSNLRKNKFDAKRQLRYMYNPALQDGVHARDELVPPPLLIALVPLTWDADVELVESWLVDAAAESQGSQAVDYRNSDIQNECTSLSKFDHLIHKSSDGSAQTVKLGPKLASSTHAIKRVTTICMPRPKQVIEKSSHLFISSLEEKRYIVKVLDALKVADLLLFVYGPREMKQFDEISLKMLAAIRAQGIPSLFCVSHAMPDVFDPEEDIDAVMETKNKTNVKVLRQGADASIRALDNEQKRDRSRLLAAQSFGDEADLRPVTMFSSLDAFNTLRLMISKNPKEVTWRAKYPYMHIDASSYDAAQNVVRLHGYIRGRALDANRLVHITDIGTLGVQRVVEEEDPCPLRARAGGSGGKNAESHMVIDSKPLRVVFSMRDEAIADSLQHAAVPDVMNMEQTWPPEMGDDDLGLEEHTKPSENGKDKTVRARPRPQVIGSGEAEDAREEGGASAKPMNHEDDHHEDEDDDDDGTLPPEILVPEDRSDSDGGEDGDGMDIEKQNEIKKVERKNEETFPDEVETPLHINARERFARYRGLKSFRTSKWDPKESLPLSYGKIFQFANFNATRRRFIQEAEELEQQAARGDLAPEDCNLAPIGSYVCLEIAPPSITEVDGTSLAGEKESIARVFSSLVHAVQERRFIILCNLHKCENRRTVMQMGVNLMCSADDPGKGPVVRSKEPVEFHIGFARFSACPIFSEDNSNSDKHKFERFLHPGRHTVASVLGCAWMPPLPVLMFHPPEQNNELVAVGSLLPPDPDRIVLKRIVLTGYPFKINKRKSTVRFMFYNPEDIRWFKPVELWTKYGKTGTILEPLGTHGYMKTLFDTPLQHSDTVCMSLYKRVFPKEEGEARSKVAGTVTTSS